MRFLLIGAALLLMQSPRQDGWRILGPGGGGAQFFPTVSPHDPKLVLVACDMTGSYVSRDGGDSWRMFNLGGVSRFFLFHPVDPDVIFAGTNALWRSDDRGEHWRLAWPEAKRVTGSTMANDHADETLLVDGNPAPRVVSLAIHREDPRRMYLALREQGIERLLLSRDGGGSWVDGGSLPEGSQKLFVNRAGTLHVVARDSVHSLEGERWRKGAVLPAIEYFSAGWSERGDLVVYAVTKSRAVVSDDSGQTWRDFRIADSESQLSAIAVSEQHPDVAYVSYSGLEGGVFGVAKTSDRGRTWTPVWSETRAERAKNVTYAWIAEKFGGSWSGNPLTVGVSPTQPGLAFTTDYGRTMRTTDGGSTWQAVYSRREPGAGWVSTGLDVTTAYGAHFDPFDPNRIFITYTDIGAFRSEDGGRTWVSSTDGIERGWTNTTYWLAFDPEVKGRVWGVFSATHDLPRPKMWRGQSPSKYRGGVGVSNDGGRAWRMLKNAGMPETAATHIWLDPKSPKESRTLYVAAFGRGVYKSTDGGESWVLKNTGLPAEEPFAWRFAPDGNGGLYLIIARRSDDGSIGGAFDGSLYHSKDGAETWRPVPLPRGVNGPNGLAVDPAEPRRLYLAAWARSTKDANPGGGIYRSLDAGRTWTPLFTRDQHVYDVTVDPVNPRVLYACGFESAAWRSADAGATWQRIPGYDFKWGHRVIPDPRDRNLIYVTTFGGSVWHGPAATGTRNSDRRPQR